MKLKNIDKEKAIRMFENSKNRAYEILKDREKSKKLVNDALKKARQAKGPFNEIFDDLILMLYLAKDYVKGDYREVSAGTIVTIVAGLIYFLTPLDIIPDFIPVVGYIDDAFVLGLVIRQIRVDLDKYRIWKLKKVDEDE